jgi:hypothetical protein
MRKLAKTRQLDRYSWQHVEPTAAWVGTRPARRSTKTELNLVVVARSETVQLGSLLVLKSVAAAECK